MKSEKANSTESLSKSKKLAFTLLLLVFSVLLTEIILQAFYRVNTGQWLWQWWAVPLYESDDLRVYHVKRNLNYLHKTSEYSARYYTNEQSFRTDAGRNPTNIEKPTNTYRVMHLGPSFTFGWGVDYEQSYTYLISKNLHVPNKRIESINVGTPAQPINYQLAWLAKQGYRYSPDLVVQTVYADCDANMATDGTLPEDLPYIEDGYLYTPRSRTLTGAAYRAVREYRRYSAVLFFGWRLYAALASGKEKSGTGMELYGETSGCDAGKLGMILGKYLSYQQFVRGALGKKVPIVFVYVPMSYIVRPADIIRVKHQGNYKDPLVERSRTKEIQQMLNDNGIHFVDLTAKLVQADEKTRMYNLYDIHFTPAGNQIAAATVTPIIQKVIDNSLLEKGERSYPKEK
jgi:hypothetical protein